AQCASLLHVSSLAGWVRCYFGQTPSIPSIATVMRERMQPSNNYSMTHILSLSPLSPLSTLSPNRLRKRTRKRTRSAQQQNAARHGTCHVQFTALSSPSRRDRVSLHFLPRMRGSSFAARGHECSRRASKGRPWPRE